MNQPPNKFFQNEKKFVVGKWYETLRVISPPYGTYESEPSDEIGKIIPKSEQFLGKYVKSVNYGYGDNGGRYDYFQNINGESVTYMLAYDGKTRYREISDYIDNRLPYLDLVEGVGNNTNLDNKNEHINRYYLNPLVIKEVCSFISPEK